MSEILKDMVTKSVVRAQMDYLLQIADNAMIIGHRLSEWCGHGPVLEQDIALTNIALDHIGQARALYQYIAEIEGDGKTEDDYPYKRDVREWKNLLLTELPNKDFGYTIARQFLYDTFNYYLMQALRDSADEHLAAIADKALKEVSYHLRYSSEWMIRLGDGTEESKDRIQKSVDDIWMFGEEAFMASVADLEALKSGVGVDLDKIKSLAEQRRVAVLDVATLTLPQVAWAQKGGKKGHHTEYLGYILADLQFLQRTYPGCEW